MNNYEFCAAFAAQRGGRVLDYGCGEGQIVSLLRSKGVDAFGCDVFYDGGTCKAPTSEYIRKMGDGIPFPDAHFDVVVNNTVMEHVADLDAVLDEIARVLKPGGVVLSIFPSAEAWRESHCGVPFLHWFPKGEARVYYAFAFRSLGFGYFHGDKTRWQWSYNFCDWLDKWTHYRPYRQIAEAFSRRFGELHHIEADWLDTRRKLPLPNAAKRLIVQKLGGLVFWCEKRHFPTQPVLPEPDSLT